MKLQPSRKLGIWMAIAIVLILAMVISASVISTQSPDFKSFLLGVLGSLVASVFFAAFVQITDNPETARSRLVAENLERIEAIRRDIQSRELEGVLSVTDKYRHQHGFWFGILQRTEKRLDMLGNSLSGWTAQIYREQLSAHILRILNNGGKVRIVLMNPRSETAASKSQLFGKDYEEPISSFISLLLKIRDRARSDGAGDRLKIYLTPLNLSYMMIRTDSEVFVSPYFSAKKGQHPLVVQLDPGSAFAEGYVEDFEKVVSRSEVTGAEHVGQFSRA